MQKQNQLIRACLSQIFSLGLVAWVSFAQIGPAWAANPLTGHEIDIINRTNQIRAEVGLPAFSVDSRLTRSATAKAVDMATSGYFGHANPDGGRMERWITPTGYVYKLAGENLAKGFSSIDRLMNAWINSPTHYKNLVEPQFTDIGVGMAEGWYEGQTTLFIVQHFGVEPTAVAKSVSQLTAPVAPLVTPLIEQVAGSTANPGQLSPILPSPELLLPPIAPTEIAAVIEPTPVVPVSTGGTQARLWPIWAILMLALIGYVLDERFVLMLETQWPNRRRSPRV